MMRASKGYASLETLRVFSRARELLHEQATVNDHITVLYGLCIGHYVRAEHAEAQEAAQQCLALAAAHQTDEAQAFADMMTGHVLWAVGEFNAARRHLERTLVISATVAEGASDLRLSSNNAVAALSYLAWTLWPLGYLDQASVRASEAVRLARGIGHVPLTAYALTAFAMYTEVVRGTNLTADQEPTDADEAVAYCVEHCVTAYEPWARFSQGLAVGRHRGRQHGIDLMRGAMKSAEKIDAMIFRPLYLGHLAASYAHVGRLEVGLRMLNEAIETVATTNERFFEAELHRLRGELLLELGNRREGEGELQRGLAIARRQQARLWELRAAVSLAGLCRDRGHRAEARGFLAPVYGWFTEGFDTPDLKKAKALLDELG
jgi:tetratricopeptide (TPR) repeat protein